MNCAKYYEKSLKIIFDEGLIVFLKKAFRLAVSKILKVTSLIVFEFDINNPCKIITQAIELSFRMASEEDIDLMNEEDYGYDAEGKKYSMCRFERGDRCVLALYDSKIIGYNWMMKDYMELSQYNHIPLPTKRVYAYKAFVLNEFRGKRVFNAMDTYLIEILRREGKIFLVTTAPKDNLPSIKARERMGFKQVGKIIQFRFLGYEYDYITKKDLLYLQT